MNDSEGDREVHQRGRQQEIRTGACNRLSDTQSQENAHAPQPSAPVEVTCATAAASAQTEKRFRSQRRLEIRFTDPQIIIIHRPTDYNYYWGLKDFSGGVGCLV